MNTGIDTIRKVVAIIAGTLAIILMVFGLCKKVGLCAEPVPVTQLPFPVGAGYGNTFTDEQIETIYQICKQDQVEAYNQGSTGYPDLSYIVFNEYNANSNTYLFYCYYDNLDETKPTMGFQRTNFTTVDFPLDGYFVWAYRTSTNYTGSRRVWIYANTFTKYSADWNNSGTMRVNCSNFTTLGANNTYTSITNQFVTGYPVWISQDCTYNDITYFTNDTRTPHSKGGVIAEITENDDIAETELPQIDTTAPIDTTSNPAWYQKILTAIGKIGLNIQSNTITTGNYLEQILTGQRNFFTDFLAVLGTHIGNITDRLDTIIGYDRENQASTLKDDWIAGYNNSDIKAITVTGQNMKTTLSNIGSTNTGNLVFGPWRLTYISGHLHLVGNYTMPEIFGGGTHQQDISFEWYESIRSWFVNIFKVFLFVGFAWYLVTQVPNMLHGTSGVFEKGRKEK